jgi:hypothetical protein
MDNYKKQTLFVQDQSTLHVTLLISSFTCFENSFNCGCEMVDALSVKTVTTDCSH